MAKPSKTVIVGGKGASLSAKDIFAVAATGHFAEVDAAALEKLQKIKNPGKSPKPAESKDASPPDTALNGTAAAPVPSDPAQPRPASKETLSREQARAAVLARLVEILAGQGVPAGGQAASLAAFYSSLLNTGVDLALPVTTSDAPVLEAIHKAAAGQGWALAATTAGESSGSASSLVALQARLGEGSEAGSPLAAPLSAVPSDLRPDSMAPSVGIASLAVHVAASQTTLADAVAALSCEALQADVVPVTELAGEQQAQHKARGEVVSDLRSLLQGSKCVNPRKNPALLKSILAVPSAHGAFREAAKAAASALRVELNPSSEGGAGEGGASAKGSSKAAGPPLPFVPSFIVSGALTSLLRSLGLVASCSIKRCQQLVQAIQQLETELSTGPAEGVSAGAGDSAAEKPWAGAVQGEAGLLLLMGTAAVVDSLRVSAAEAGRDVALGDIGDEMPGSLPLAEDSTSGMRQGLGMLKLSSMELAKGVPSVAVAVAACQGADGLLQALALEALLSLRLLALREAQQARRAPAGKAGKGGAASAGLVLGKGSSLLREQLAAVLEGEDGAKDPFSAVLRAFDPRGGQLEGLEQKLKGAIESNETRRAPKIAKGTRDFLPDQMAIRERAFGIISSVFKRHGAVALDTPVFELRETLTGKYGEDSKLIYDLADQGGEILSLRYDLTVPFARYLAMHSVGNIKRYHMARVYRRDNPQMSRGRYREFYQCDFDIAGQYALMVPDSEVLKVLTELLDELDIGEFEIKLNHRRLLDGMLEICGVPSSKFRAICSAVDKLDKEPWEAVKLEMISEKGLSEEVADRIGAIVVRKGKPLELLAQLQGAGSPFAGHLGSQAALQELGVLFGFLQAMGALHRISFDLSLARGLDYYTGVIYEAVFCGGSQVGSIAAGGRYDNLVGMFSGKQVPAVGVSLGIERVFTIMEEKERSKNELIRSTETEVLVASIGKELLKKRMEVTSLLWAAGLKAEFVMAEAPNMQRQLEYANKAGIPWMVLFGSDEIEKGSVKVKDLTNRTEEEVALDNVVEYMRQRLRPYGPK